VKARRYATGGFIGQGSRAPLSFDGEYRVSIATYADYVRRFEEAIANDQHMTEREQGGRLCDRSLFAHVSDLELACLYKQGPAHLHDAAYCELHLRRLTPWKIQSSPTELTP